MAFPQSPGINVSEIDLTTVVPSLASTTGAFAGKFAWGPVDEITTISDEVRLVDRFGKPDSTNYEYWFSAANFLAYSNNLQVIRSANTNSTFNAVSARKTVSSISVTSGGGSYANGFIQITEGLVSGNAANVQVVVNTEGSVIALTVVNADQGVYDYVPNFTLSGGTSLVYTINTSNATANTLIIKNDADWEANYSSGSVSNGLFAARYPGSIGNTLKVSVADSASYNTWTYKTYFTSAPSTSSYAASKGASNDELHVIVIDEDGKLSGTQGAILEKYEFLSKASDAKDDSGNTNYYKNVIANKSKYIHWMNHTVHATGNDWGTVANTQVYASINAPITQSFISGSDGNVATANVSTSYAMFGNSETSDISLVISGPADATIATQLIALVDSRKDCMVFVSPEKADVVDNAGSELTDITAFRNSIGSTSYAVMDSNWKYQYDKYNDLYRWVPLNGDVAGLCAKTDRERDAWWSPGGSSRGLIKNVIKLAWNPNKTDRDELYKIGVNPIVSFPGEGPQLFGDKTLLSKTSAFDRINVRRLFITIEKNIARAARSILFEFNDQFTRAQFIAMVEPYLRDVQGRRGITEFRVVCDETNNTSEVIDTNRFVGDIYVVPARSINFIQLNFIASRTGVDFSEIVGKF